MILTIKLTKEETKQTMLGLVVCRNPVKKGLKKVYGFFKGREYVETYDIVKEKFVGLYDDNSEQDYCLEFNKAELDMLSSFLNFYINEIKKEERISETYLSALIALESTLEKVKAVEEQEACLVN